MATSLFHARRASVKNQTPGYRNRAFIAAASQFTTIAEPDPAGSGAAKVTITDDHEFTGTAASNGFWECYLLPRKTQAPGESVGENGSLSMIWKPQLFFPGDSPALQAMMEELINEDVIMLLEDASCPDGGVRQYGCDCTPCTVSKTTFTSATFAGTESKGWLLELEVSCRFFYDGTIEVHP